MPSRDRRSSALENGNPFKDDPEIKKALGSLGSVNNKAEFNGWRFSFLTKFDSFLDKEGSEKADVTYQDFFGTVFKLVKAIQKLEELVADGALTKDTASVKARQCMEEIKAECMYTSDDLADLLPGSSQSDDSEKKGYTNYHMGAILIGDGFSLYGYLSSCDETLMAYKEKILQHIADRQILAEIDNYHKKLEIFCDVMRDLGLYAAMMKAREIETMEPESDEEDEEEEEEYEEPIPPRPITPEPEPEPAPPKAKPKAEVLAIEYPEPEPEPAPKPIKRKSSKKKEEEPDLPPTAKPKAKMQLPGATPRGTKRMSLPPTPAPAAPAPKPRRETMPPRKINTTPPKARAASNVPILDHIMTEADKAGVPDKPKKRKRKSKYKKDDGPDLPKTTKPKAKPKFGGDDAGMGRGPGRTLSKEDAKEKQPPKISVKRPSKAPAPKSDTMDNGKPTPLVREPQPYGMEEPEKEIPLTREPQPYGMAPNESPMPLEREPQPYGMAPSEQPMPLEREPQPYSMAVENKPDMPKKAKSKSEPKPKPQPKMPKMPDDGGRGRGVGRQLSKEEAKEKTMPKVCNEVCACVSVTDET
jgi:hypothetical protein